MKAILVLVSIFSVLWAVSDAPVCDPLSEVGCPRAMALGNAYVAVANDWSAISYNSAAPAFRGSAEIAASVDSLGLPVAGQMLAVGFPTYQLGSWGARLVTLGASNIDGRDPVGNPTHSYSARDWRLDLDFAYPFLSYLGAGIIYKQYWRTLAGHSKPANGLDIGFIAIPFAPYNEQKLIFNMGASAENLIAPRTGFRNTDLTWPRMFRAGMLLGHTDPFGSPISIAVNTEADIVTGASSRFRAGIEISYGKAINLRAGFDSGHVNAGLGIILDYLSLDYAALFTDIALANCMLLSYDFDYTVAQLRHKRLQAEELVASGREYYELGNYSEALSKFRQASELETQDPNITKLTRKAEIESLFKSGKANFMAERYEAAVNDFTKAKDLDLTDHRIAGYLELSEQKLQLARELAERQAKALELAAIARNTQKEGNYIKALAQIKEAMQFDPYVIGGKELFASIKRDISREEATKQTSPPVTTEMEFPDEAHAQYRRSLNDMQSGSYSAAVYELNLLYERYPKYPGLAISLSKAYTYLATEAFTQGKLTESISQLKIALQYDSSNERAHKLLERAESELQQIKGGQ